MKEKLTSLIKKGLKKRNSLLCLIDNSNLKLDSLILSILEELNIDRVTILDIDNSHPKNQRSFFENFISNSRFSKFILITKNPVVVQSLPRNGNLLLACVEKDDIFIKDWIIYKNLNVNQILTSDLFGLESSRSKELSELLKEHEKYLLKDELTQEEKKELEEIEKKIGNIPTAQSAWEIKATNLISAFAKGLGDKNDR